MPEPDNLKDLFIADLEHFGQSLWRNEEIGEKRFNFFLTLVTAVVAGLATLQASERKLPPNALTAITNGALAGLLLLGVLTYLRLLHRNRVTDQYQRTLKHIRGKLLDLNQPSTGYDVPQPLDARRWKWFRGGLAETVGAIEAVLLCALLVFNSIGLCWAGAISLLILIVAWVLAAPRTGVS